MKAFAVLVSLVGFYSFGVLGWGVEGHSACDNACGW